MPGPTTAVRRAKLKDRVSHAYYTYGRFVSCHPLSCLFVGIVSMLLLSYPAVLRLKLPTSGPIDIRWSDDLEPMPMRAKPDWFDQPARLFIQQIVVRSWVQPWQPANMGPMLAVKGSLSRSFSVLHAIHKRQSIIGSLDDFCLRVPSVVPQGAHHAPLMPPSESCLLLSPALFWNDTMEAFYRDGNALSTIFATACTSDMCARDLLFGIPTGATGVKRSYRTNRQRTIDFAITLVLSDYNEAFIRGIKNSLKSDGQFSIWRNDAEKQDRLQFAHVFYRPHKYLSDWLPLMSSYLILVVYVYFSARKIEMVKSKLGIAFASVATIASTLTMTLGICCQLELTPTLWGAELFPYLAMIVGLENTLCITRSVAWTPVNMDVRTRISQGLSREGYSITKNFLTELLIITIGLFTFVPDIQEFCAFSCIGLVIDFFMQLTFFVPCLTWDLHRLGTAEKQQLGITQLKADFPELNFYPPSRCPFESLLPGWFPNDSGGTGGARIYRARSAASGIDTPAFQSIDGSLEYPDGNRSSASTRQSTSHSIVQKQAQQKKAGAIGGQPAGPTLGHRRALSSGVTAVEMVQEESNLLRMIGVPRRQSHRVRFLLFWTRTRFFQRTVMVVVVAWILWFAFLVHRMEVLTHISKVVLGPDKQPSFSIPSASISDENANETATNAAKTMEENQLRILSAAVVPLQKRTFHWWPVLLERCCNITLSGRYISVLPPILLTTVIAPSEPVFLQKPSDTWTSKGSTASDQLKAQSEPDTQRQTIDDGRGEGQKSQTEFDGAKLRNPKEPTAKPTRLVDVAVGERISWLELQMTLVLLMSVGVFAAVAGFLVYVCCGCAHERLSSVGVHSTQPAQTRGTHRRVGSRAVVESVPLMFVGHEQDIECICVRSATSIVSSCIGGKVYIWNATTGDLLRSLRRRRDSSGQQQQGSPSNGMHGMFTPSNQPLVIVDRRANGSNDTMVRRRTVSTQQQQQRHSDDVTTTTTTAQQHRGWTISEGTPSSSVGVDVRSQLPSASVVWCVSVKANLVVIGCADGSVEFWDGDTAQSLGTHSNRCGTNGGCSTSGVTQVLLRGSRLVVARLCGVLDFVDLRIVAGDEQSTQQPQQSSASYYQHAPNPEQHGGRRQRIVSQLLKSLTAHQHPINCLTAASMVKAVTASDDHTVKLFDLRSCSLTHTLHGHNAPVHAVVVDELVQVAYSSCAQGVICCWDMLDGQLLRTVTDAAPYMGSPGGLPQTPLAIATTSTLLLGYDQQCNLWLWNKNTGQLVTRIHRSAVENGVKTEERLVGFGCDQRVSLVALGDAVAASCSSGAVQFWDLDYKVLLREVKLEGSPGANVDRLTVVDRSSIICTKGTSLYRISLPFIKL